MSQETIKLWKIYIDDLTEIIICQKPNQSELSNKWEIMKQEVKAILIRSFLKRR